MYKIAILGCENSHANSFLDYIIKDKLYNDIEVIGVYSDDMEAAQKLNETYGVYVASAYNSAAGIREPSEVQFWVSEDNEAWVEAGNVYVTDDGTTSCIAVSLSIDKAVKGRYIQYRFKPKSNWVMVAEVEAYGEKAEDIIYGDINNDTKVDSLDYLLLKRACFKTYTLSEQEYKRANLNFDDGIDSSDYLLIKRIAFGTYTVTVK